MSAAVMVAQSNLVLSSPSKLVLSNLKWGLAYKLKMQFLIFSQWNFYIFEKPFKIVKTNKKHTKASDAKNIYKSI